MRPDAWQNYDYGRQAFDDISIMKLSTTIIGRIACLAPMQTDKIA